MADWHAAPSVAAILSQATALCPTRDKRSDGIIGDARHQAEPTSDHNPDGLGCVHAADLTHGPYWGSADLDCGPLVAAIIARKDPRVRYMIFQRRIISGNHGPSPWKWRPYSGPSAHLEHVHISINYDTASENDTSPWFAPATKPGGLSLPGADPTPEDDMSQADVDDIKTTLHRLDGAEDGRFTQLMQRTDEIIRRGDLALGTLGALAAADDRLEKAIAAALAGTGATASATDIARAILDQLAAK